jgi:hypothetical protein
MPEGLNIELSHRLAEPERAEPRRERWQDAIELVEVGVLAVVAVATAWSGFQSAKWDGRQALLYGRASSLRFVADAASTEGGQELVADSSMFDSWLQVEPTGNTQLENIFIRRFSPEYRVAFYAWLKTNPFVNPNAPAGPRLMPEYDNAWLDKADVLNQQASETFDTGTADRETGEKYVRATVLFASVLFMVAIAQRMKRRAPRVGANLVAFGLLAVAVATVATLPRL